MKQKLLIILLGSILIPASANALRCAHGVVWEGDTAKEVVKKCGEPYETYTGGILSDELYFTYVYNGMKTTIKFFKGTVKEETEDRL